jgi:HlyD family secretion protein
VRLKARLPIPENNVKHHLRRLIIIGILLAIGAGLGWYWSQPTPILVRLQAVETGEVQATIANTRAGTVKACRRAKISPSMGGLITNLPIKRGDTVKSGQLLLELWNHDLAAQVQLAERQADEIAARATEVCVNAGVASREADRLLKLQKQNLASEDAVERAVGQAEASQAACNAARESVRVAKAQIGVTKETLERIVLEAPFAGTVAEINGELGEYVTPSPPGIPTPPAVDLVDNSCLYISAPIDEVDAPAVKVGLPARITLDAFPNETFEGRVRRIAPYVLEIEKQARTVEVEGDFTNPADYARLLAGYSADLEIILDTRDKVLRIPTEAVLEGKRVLVYDANDKRLHSRDIVTGLSNWKLTEVRAGLVEGERVVVSVDREGVEAGVLAEPE